MCHSTSRQYYLSSNFRTETRHILIRPNFRPHHHLPPHVPRIQIGSLRSDTAAGRHQGLKIFSASIIRASALNTGIYIRRAYARVQVHACACACTHRLCTRLRIGHLGVPRCLPEEANGQFDGLGYHRGLSSRMSRKRKQRSSYRYI